MLEDGLEKAKKLLKVQFDPNNPQQVIAPAMVTVGLRPNQFSRVWFVVSGNSVTFLAIGSHMQNYDNNEMDRCALERFSEIN